MLDMVFTSFVSFVLLGLQVVTASPLHEIRDSPISLRIASHINATGGTAALIRADRARLAALRATRRRRDVIIPVQNSLVTYTCGVPIGEPPTSYTLLVDTGSSNTWVGVEKAYVITNSSRKTSNSVGVSYGSGSFSGTEYTDTVQLGTAAIQAQSIGVASSSRGFGIGVDGILGIGPVDLTLDTLFPDTTSTIPTVTDNLKTQNFTSSALIGISFEPDTNSAPDGQLDFGGVDFSRFSGPIEYVPVTSVEPAADYWGITQQITYGASTVVLPSTSAGIVDTGTTLLYLPEGPFTVYQGATGGVVDTSTGLLRITPAQYAGLESLRFLIGSVTYEFTPNAQIWPRHLNTDIGGSADAIYLVVANSGTRTGSGLDFINGFTWLQRFYTVFDSDARRIGFATTPNTFANTN